MPYREQDLDRSILVVAGDSLIRGFERERGALVWSFEMRAKGEWFGDIPVSGAIELAFVGGQVVAATTDRLVWLAYETGALIHEVKFEARGHRPVFVIEADRVYVATGVTLACYGIDGQRAWSTDLGSSFVMKAFALGLPGNVRQSDWAG